MRCWHEESCQDYIDSIEMDGITSIACRLSIGKKQNVMMALIVKGGHVSLVYWSTIIGFVKILDMRIILSTTMLRWQSILRKRIRLILRQYDYSILLLHIAIQNNMLRRMRLKIMVVRDMGRYLPNQQKPIKPHRRK